MEVYIVALVLLSTVLSLGAINFAFKCMVEVEAFKKSTHRVQYVGATKDQIKVSDEPNDLDSSGLDVINKNHKENVESVLDFFAPSDEDRELKPRRSL